MQTLAGKVAVVTGAASGIGLGMAERFAAEGMQVVMADIEPEALSIAAEGLKGKAASILPHRLDVRDPDAVEGLARATYDAFGACHVVCNNAGVEVIGLTWEYTLEDWEWVLGVNLWGVIHGVRAFVPRMLAGGEEGHIVNTASMAGLTTSAFMGIYDVTKHGVVALSESLYKDFKATGARLSVSVLCPGLINTNIMNSRRNRPGPLQKEGEFGEPARMFRAALTAGLATGFDPSEVAAQVAEGIKEDRFYIVPAQDNLKVAISARAQDLIELRNPTIAPPPPAD
ncbi:MAG: SDR family NAD(P)-dependent oxidoreductase [Dehalococcoidia bacterium]